MTVKYQGETVETAAGNVAEFLASRGFDPAKALVEYDGEVYPPGADLGSLALRPDAPLEVFRLTAGG